MYFLSVHIYFSSYSHINLAKIVLRAEMIRKLYYLFKFAIYI